MKKIFISLFSIFAISMLFSNIASAQTNSTSTPSSGTVVATINISNAKIVSNSGRDYKISFDISNRVGAQPQIKYSVRLTELLAKSELQVDEKVYDETLSLGENSAISKVVDYSIPTSLSIGTYHIWIDSKNGSGLPLGVAFAGEVRIIENTPNTIQIVPGSCSLMKDTGAEKYTLSQGVTIKSTDTLIAKCKIQSNFSTNVTVAPSFITRSHTAFGDVSTANGGSNENITIKKGSNDISFALPKASKPQDYNLSFSLVSADSKIVSNTISLSYVLAGQTGTIQNVVFDKTYYKAGDTANIQIFSTQNGASTVTATVFDGNGIPCSATSTKQISNFSIISISIPIIKDCINPKADIILSADGNILDSKNFQVTTVMSTTTPTTITATGIIIFVTLIVLVLIAGGLVYKKKYSALKVFVLTLVFSASFFGSSRADVPVITLSASPNPVAYGASTNISFTASNSNSCTLTGNGSTLVYPGVLTYLSQFGSAGAGNGQFNDPSGVAVDSSGNIYIVDTKNNRVEKFNSSLTYLSQFGSLGSGNGQFNAPSGIALDSAGNIYVADTNNSRIKKFDSSGTYLSQFGLIGYGVNGNIWITPTAVAVDSLGNIYATDFNYKRIRKFDSSGTNILQFGYSSGDIPTGIAFDSGSNIYVTYRSSSVGVSGYVQKFNSSGTYLSQFSTSGSYGNPDGIALDSFGNFYSANSYDKYRVTSADTYFHYNVVEKFDSLVTYISQFAYFDFGAYATNPFGITLDSSGNIFVTNTRDNNVQKFGNISSGSSNFGNLTSNTTFSLSCTGSGGSATSYVTVSVIPPTCTSWTYSAWGTCSNGQQTRTVLSSSPSGCTGGTPILSQTCSNLDISANPMSVSGGNSSTISWNAIGVDSCTITKQNDSAWSTTTTGAVTMTTYTGTGATPSGIAFDGTNMWTANTGTYVYPGYSNGSVTKISPNGSMTTYAGGATFTPQAIAFDGVNMWTANGNKNSVTKITPTGVMTTYPTAAGIYPSSIAFDGTNMWTANSTGNGYNNVTKIAPDGTMTNYNSTNNYTNAIRLAFDGTNMWTGNNNNYGYITTKFTPTGGATTYSGSCSGGIIASDGTNMWIGSSCYGNPRAIKVSPTGSQTLYSLTAGNSYGGIAFDGTNMWISSSYGPNTITKVDPTGVVTDYAGGGNGQDIAFDGTNMWMVNPNGNSVVKINTGNNITGSKSSGPLASDTFFTATCTKGANSVTKSVIVSVATTPITLNLNASPLSVVSGSASTISWSTTGANSCSITKNGAAFATGVSGSQSSGNLSANTTFAATCTNINNSANSSVIVTVTPTPIHPTNDCTNLSTCNFIWTDPCTLTVDATGVGTLACTDPVNPANSPANIVIPSQDASICTPSQGTSTSMYINRNTLWNIANSGGTMGDVRWFGTDLSPITTAVPTRSLNKIYTTVGQKTMNGLTIIATSSISYVSTCYATTTMKLDPGTSGGI